MKEPKMKTKVVKLKKKYAIILVIALLGVFGLVLGVSYAFFSHSVTSKEYLVYAGTLEIEYEKETNVVNLQDTRPMTNTEGLETTPYSFNVKNTGSLEAKYQVRLELSNSTDLPLEYVKVSVYKNDTEYLEPTRISDLNSTLVIVDDGLLDGKTDETPYDNYKVRFWVDINAGNDTVGKTFGARVVIDAMQDVEEGYFVDTKPIITLNKDSNGNTDIYLEKNGTYTELGVASVRDDKDTLKVNDVDITGTVDTTTVGIYPITYTITDSDNNTTEVTRRVIVNDGTLPVYRSVSEVVSSFNQSDLQEAVVCSHIYGDGDLYLDCEIKDTLASAIAARNVSTIIMTKDVTVSSTLGINDGKDITLNVNGKTINGFANVFYVRGGTFHLTGDGIITDESTNVNTQNGVVKIWGSHNSKLIVDGGTCDTLDPTNHTTGLLLYVGDNNQCAIANYGAYENDTQTADIIINGGCYYSTSGRSVVVTGNTNSQINNAYMYGGTNAVYVSTTLEGVKTDITGGTYIGGTTSIMNNSAIGLININQTTTPVYIKSLAVTWNPAIVNNSSGRINITANQANQCTTNESDTTSGLCVYAEGDKTYTASTANGALQNQKGIVSINGGTYFGGYQGLNNGNIGTLNINNAVVNSERWAVLNANTGTINLCNSNVSGSVRDLYNSTTGAIYYNNVIFSNGTTTPDSSNIYNPNGTITPSATCPISD